jgi:hypothetical protein
VPRRGGRGISQRACSARATEEFEGLERKRQRLALMSGDGWVKPGDVVLLSHKAGPMSELFEAMVLAVDPDDKHHVAMIDHLLVGDDDVRLKLGSPIQALYCSFRGFGDTPEGVQVGRVITRFSPVPTATVVGHWIKAAGRVTGFPLPSSPVVVPVLGSASLVVRVSGSAPQPGPQGPCPGGGLVNPWSSCSGGDASGDTGATSDIMPQVPSPLDQPAPHCLPPAGSSFGVGSLSRATSIFPGDARMSAAANEVGEPVTHVLLAELDPQAGTILGGDSSPAAVREVEETSGFSFNANAEAFVPSPGGVDKKKTPPASPGGVTFRGNSPLPMLVRRTSVAVSHRLPAMGRTAELTGHPDYNPLQASALGPLIAGPAGCWVVDGPNKSLPMGSPVIPPRGVEMVGTRDMITVGGEFLVLQWLPRGADLGEYMVRRSAFAEQLARRAGISTKGQGKGDEANPQANPLAGPG